MSGNVVKSIAVLALFWISVISAVTQVSVTTFHNDNSRTGQNIQEAILTPSNVKPATFGKLFSQPIDGFAYAQPLYVPNVKIPGQGTHNVVYVATMNDSVYAFDADSNTGGNARPLWQENFADPAQGIIPVPLLDVHCTDSIVNVGILSTPVIDTSSSTMYVLARTLESGTYYHRLHALDITTGEEKFGGPVEIQASITGTGTGSHHGTISFNPQLESQRSALLLQNGQVYVAWSSLCDYSSYHGWVMAYDASTLAQSAVWLVTPDGSQGGIWQSGNGPAADSSGYIYTSTGNGSFDINNGGLDYGESVVKLGPPSGGVMPVLDYFTPYNFDEYNTNDWDIASSGMVLLPDQTGPYPHLLVQSDKAGDLYVINRDNMGHFNDSGNGQIVQYFPALTNKTWSSPSWWNNYIYLGAEGNDIQAFPFDTKTGLFSSKPSSKTTARYQYPGTTVSISSNQATNGIVWALNVAGWSKTTTSTYLQAYDATNLATELYSSRFKPERDDPGAPVKNTVPTIANGKVYVGTQTTLSVYGLLK